MSLDIEDEITEITALTEDEITADFPIPVMETIMVPVQVKYNYDGALLDWTRPTASDIEKALKEK